MSHTADEKAAAIRLIINELPKVRGLDIVREWLAEYADLLDKPVTRDELDAIINRTAIDMPIGESLGKHCADAITAALGGRVIHKP